VWDFSTVADKKIVDIEITRKALSKMGIDEQGLTNEDRRILEIIIKNYSGGPVGVQTIAVSLGDSEDTIEDIYEPYLIRQGLLKKTSRGRMCTPLAFEYMGIKMNKENQLF
jgi:Holliday junction DNA helicase RuvB